MSYFKIIENNIRSFEDAILEVENAFSGKSYTKIQTEILKELFHIHGLEKFRRCAIIILKERDTKPHPNFWKTQLRNMSGGTASFADAQEYEPCHACKDTGKVFIKKEFLEHNGKQVLGLCYCPEGLREDEKLSGLPRFDRSQWGLVDTFPTDLFLPAQRSGTSESNSFADFFEDNLHIIESWKKMIENSKDYWAKQVNAGKA